MHSLDAAPEGNSGAKGGAALWARDDRRAYAFGRHSSVGSRVGSA
jgi:hypothetical protein